MKLKEILGKIKAILGADASAEITSLLADADRQLGDLLESKAAADRESAERKATIREQAEKITQLESEVQKSTSPEAKAELERLKKIEEQHNLHLTEQETSVRNQWKEALAVLNVDNTSKLFDKVSKVKGKFAFAEEGKDLSIEQVKQNLLIYSALQDAGHFTVETTDAGGKSPANPNGGHTKTGSPLGYIQSINKN